MYIRLQWIRINAHEKKSKSRSHAIDQHACAGFVTLLQPRKHMQVLIYAYTPLILTKLIHP